MNMSSRCLQFVAVLAVVVLAATCGLALAGPSGGPMAIRMEGFVNGGKIPARFTCDGEDLSPAFSWSHLPAGTKSLALICHDPDAPAGDWVHWVLFNIPARPARVAEHAPRQGTLPGGARQGINDFKKMGYNGPCPPGGTHRYYFRLYALDTVLGLGPGATRAQLVAAMKGHVLGETQWMGRYQR